MKILIVSLIILVGLTSLLTKEVEAQGKRISKENYFGCTNRSYFDKLITYASQKDTEAFKKGLTAGVLIGRCTYFKEGEEVFIADTAVFSGLVKVRRKGEIDEYWTVIEATK